MGGVRVASDPRIMARAGSAPDLLSHPVAVHKVVDPKHLVLRINHVDAMTAIPSSPSAGVLHRETLRRACPDPRLASVWKYLDLFTRL